MSNLSALVGAVISCWYPQHDKPSQPGPKFRPVLVVGFDSKAKRINVVYGSSQRTHQLGRGEITFTPDEINGLSKDTKFSLRNAAWLPLCSDFFACSSGKYQILGTIPKARLGQLEDAIEETV